jgi:hypothetical protein
MVVVCDHDSRVLARRTFRCRAWDLGTALDWAAQRAVAKGFAGVTVACEPTGHRWRVLGQLAADRGMPFVSVQPMQTAWTRRSEDLTFDKTDLLTAHRHRRRSQGYAAMSTEIAKLRACGFRGRGQDPGTTESGHVVLNHAHSFSSLPLFNINSSRP